MEKNHIYLIKNFQIIAIFNQNLEKVAILYFLSIDNKNNINLGNFLLQQL